MRRLQTHQLLTSWKRFNFNVREHTREENIHNIGRLRPQNMFSSFLLLKINAFYTIYSYQFQLPQILLDPLTSPSIHIQTLPFSPLKNKYLWNNNKIKSDKTKANIPK